MSRYVYLVDTDDERNTLFRGAIREWFKAQGIPALRSTVRRGWYVRTERVADVVARLEHDGYVVRRAAK